MKMYWLHCDGPDGTEVILGFYHSWTQTWTLPEDSRDATPKPDNNGVGFWLHKWHVLEIQHVDKPQFSDQALATLQKMR